MQSTLPPSDELLDLLPDAVCVVNAEGRVLFVNAGFERILGYSRAEVIGQQMFDFVHPDDREATRQQAAQVTAGTPQRHYRNRYRHKNGQNVDMQWSAVWWPEHRVRVGVAREVSELRLAERELEHRASHDPLTGLPNRYRLQLELQRAFEHAERTGGGLTVLYLDLDGFKATNDHGGHDAGDRILQEVAQRLLQGMRQSDFVARVGGDEFVVLLPGCRDAAAAHVVADALRERLRPPYPGPAGPTHMDASVGIACYPVDGRDAETLLVHADRAMYAAKREATMARHAMDAPVGASAPAGADAGTATGSDTVEVALR